MQERDEHTRQRCGPVLSSSNQIRLAVAVLTMQIEVDFSGLLGERRVDLSIAGDLLPIFRNGVMKSSTPAAADPPSDYGLNQWPSPTRNC